MSDGIESMPETGENVAEQFGISRDDQDRFAWRSQQRAAAAQQAGFFTREIAPIDVPVKGGTHTVSVDEHPRAAFVFDFRLILALVWLHLLAVATVGDMPATIATLVSVFDSKGAAATIAELAFHAVRLPRLPNRPMAGHR